MKILSYSVLNSACLSVLAGSKFYSSFLTDAHSVLYHTGCRPIELLDSKRWVLLDSGDLRLSPAKGNYDRIVPFTNLPLSFLAYIQDQPSSFNLVTYYKTANLYNHLWPISQCFIKQKQVDQYVFRHRYVKFLAISGLTDSEIQKAMGWVSLSVVREYVDSVITYN